MPWFEKELKAEGDTEVWKCPLRFTKFLFTRVFHTHTNTGIYIYLKFMVCNLTAFQKRKKSATRDICRDSRLNAIDFYRTGDSIYAKNFISLRKWYYGASEIM